MIAGAEDTKPADLVEFAWIWNRRARQGTPALHRRVLRWKEAALAAGDRRLLLMAFRGAGKSTLVGLFCAWRLYREPDTRILVLAADHALATRMVATVRRILARHPLCGALLPEAGQGGEWASDRFTVVREAVLRDASMLAAGIAGNFTGARAEIIICDDVEVAGNCDTPAKREELRERLTEAEFVLTPGGTVLVVGTPHTAESLYAETEKLLEGYRRLVIPLLDAAGESAWPERFPAEAVAKLRDRVGPLAFRRQMLLEPVAEEAARLDPALIARYAAEPDYREANGRAVLTLMGRRLVSGGAWWDPAFGRPGAGDASVVAASFADAEGRHFLHRLLYVTHDPGAAADPATQQCGRVAALLAELHLPVIRVETNGIGRFLPGLLRQAIAEAGIACTVIEVSSRIPKAQRILGTLDPLLAARRLSAHESVFRTRFAQEMAAWRPEAAGQRDDALDALAGCIGAEPVRLPSLPPRSALPGWRGG